MSVHNLDALFKPASITLIGASDRPGSIGAVLMRNLLDGGFRGTVTAVNPRHKQIAGRRAYPDVASLPESPDLGVICTPPAVVAGVVDALGAKGTRAAVIITAGFGERGGTGGVALQQAVQQGRTVSAFWCPASGSTRASRIARPAPGAWPS
jgi:acetyltransferase